MYIYILLISCLTQIWHQNTLHPSRSMMALTWLEGNHWNGDPMTDWIIIIVVVAVVVVSYRVLSINCSAILMRVPSLLIFPHWCVFVCLWHLCSWYVAKLAHPISSLAIILQNNWKSIKGMTKHNLLKKSNINICNLTVTVRRFDVNWRYLNVVFAVQIYSKQNPCRTGLKLKQSLVWKRNNFKTRIDSRFCDILDFLGRTSDLNEIWTLCGKIIMKKGIEIK